MFCTFMIVAIFLNSISYAHGINYELIDNKGVILKISYSSGEPLSFGNFEIFAPGEKIPHQKGKTDKNGIISFYPDKKGLWTIVITDDTEHGIHKKTIELKVEDEFKTQQAKMNFVEKYSKVIAGIGLIIGIFGFIVLIKNRKK